MALDQVLIHVVLLGLAAGFVAAVVRTFVPSTWRSRKPWGCALCMGWWSTLILWALRCSIWVWVHEASIFVIAPLAFHAVVTLFAGAALAALVNNWIVPIHIELE